MCGYGCVSCGACGKPKAKIFSATNTCPICGAIKSSFDEPCSGCGVNLAPGRAISRPGKSAQEGKVVSN